MAKKPPPRQYRYFELVMAAFVTVYLCSNLIGPGKAVQMELPLLGLVTFGAGVLFFPLSYVFGDVLTEVYGYARARRVIWTGFAAMLFAAIMAWVVVKLPPAPGWMHQGAFEVAYGNAWRVVLASLVAYSCGEFVNAFIMAKMKVATGGRHLWSRTIGSTIAGEGIDSLLFYPLAFWGAGIIPDELIPRLMLSQWIAKVAVEVVLTPATYAVVGFLKRAENEDHFDRDTNFNPFRISDA